MQNRSTNNKGFTLIELLVVIAIIVVLATMAMTSYKTANVKARNSRKMADLEQLRSALEMERTNNNVYPNATDYATMISSQHLSGTDPKGISYSYHPRPVAGPYTKYILTADWEGANNPNPCSWNTAKYCAFNP